jgi:glycosyltransferase involved in cell wall biosynthesis
MRVLLVNDHPPGASGGVEVHLALLCDALRQAGDEVEVASPAVDRRGLRRLRDVWDREARRQVEASAQRHRADIVHHHNVLRELSPSVLTASPGLPRVVTVHDHRLLGTPDAGVGPLTRLGAALTAAVARRAVREADAVVAVDDATAGLLTAAGFPSVERIDLFAADPGPPVAPAGEGVEIVFAGRLAADKGAAELIEAFVRVAPAHPEARLVLLGDGPLRGSIEAAAAALPGRIEVLGARPHGEALTRMATARAVAVPSVPGRRPETGPQTVLEAALRARPVVTSAGLPLARLVEQAAAGAVVPPGDVDALAAAIEHLLHHPEEATAAGCRARDAALARHVPAVVVPELRALYARLLGRRST